MRVRLISNQRIELFLFLSIFFLETLVVLKRMSTFVVYYYTVTFDFPEDKLEQHLQNDIWIRVRSEGMELRLPAEVQAVVVDVEDMETNFYGLRCDTLSFRTRYLARLEDCHVTALAAQAQSLHLNSGTVRNLYLNLDEIADWDVNTGSFHIDTEHLSGSRYHRCLLQKNECRRVFWTPLKDDASLSVELKQAVKIEVGE